MRDREAQRIYQKAHNAKLRAYRRDNQLCPHCGGERDSPPLLTCSTCREKQRVKDRKRRALIAQSGKSRAGRPREVLPGLLQFTNLQRQRVIAKWEREEPARYALYVGLLRRSARAISNIQMSATQRDHEMRTLAADTFDVVRLCSDPAAEWAYYEPSEPRVGGPRNCSITGFAIREYGEAA